MATKTRVMTAEEKAERSRKARLKFVPIRNVRQHLFDMMVEAQHSQGNTLTHDEMNMHIMEAAKLQLSWKLGPNGMVTVKSKDGVESKEYKSLTWSKLAIDEQGDIVRAIRGGTSLKFSYLKTGDEIEPVIEADDDEDGEEIAA